MLVVQTFFPEHLTGSQIQICPGAAVQKSRIHQPQHRTRYQRIILLHPVCDLTEYESSRDIGRTLIVVTTAVDHEHAFCLDVCTVFRSGTVMDDGTVGAVSADGVKAGLNKGSMFPAQLLQLLIHTDFRHRHLAHGCLQPVHKLCHCDGIHQVCLSQIFLLSSIFH